MDTAEWCAPNSFPDTRRSAVAAACSDDAARRRPAQETIVAAYWKPVFSYIRIRWRRSDEDAKDLTQSFFAALIEKGWLNRYDSSKGTFRTFLRVCLDRFLANDHKFAGRQKRSGDVAAAAGPESPAEIFEREWERCVFEDAVDELRESLRARGRDLCFAVFERYDLNEESVSYEQISREFEIPVTTVTNYLAAARRELRKLVLDRLR